MIKRYLRYFDWISFIFVLLISLIGIIFVYSSTYSPALPSSIFFKKQTFGVITGVIIYFIFCFVDYRKLCRWGYFIYFILIGLLIFTLIKGSIGLGGQRWINLGIFKFQPSELIKLFFPAYFVFYLETKKFKPEYGFKDFKNIFAVLIISFLLIRKQPDLGTALIVLLTGMILFWLAGIKKNFFIWAFIIFVVTTPITWQFLKTYQKKRIEVFLGGGNKQKERYQIEQSIIAIGSGGITGKGFLNGTQNKFEFLPESRTDFIFSVLCEETGLIGALILLFLYCALFFRLTIIISYIPSFFDKLLAAGLLIPIVLATLINLSMVNSLLPSVGIPLPLMSYGISHLWATFASLGWINGIIMRNH